jgi:AcrR family transcriptional regulator
MAKSRSPDREPSREARRLARKERRHAQRRRAIMEAARQLLLSHGIEHFTVSSVASIAEVSKPAVYYYFDSKEDLVGALAAEALAAETQAMRAAIEGVTDGVRALESAMRAYVQHYVADLDRFRILYMWTQVLAIASRVVKTDAYAERNRLDEELARMLDQQPRGQRWPADDGTRLVALARATAQGAVCSACLGGLAGGPAGLSAPELCDVACRLLADASGDG